MGLGYENSRGMESAETALVTRVLRGNVGAGGSRADDTERWTRLADPLTQSELFSDLLLSPDPSDKPDELASLEQRQCRQ